jgi:DNA-binding response OmpR family regulator
MAPQGNSSFQFPAFPRRVFRLRLHFQAAVVIRLLMKPRILFVDDETSMLEILALFFRDKGYEVATAETGLEAMRLADEGRFDLAIFDINLAGENGLQLLSYFKSSFPGLPVVLFTSLPENDELLDQAAGRGASGFMRKTESLEDLCAAVRSYLPNR